MPLSSQASVRTLLLLLVLACLGPGLAGAALLFIHQYQEGRAQQERNTIQTARALVQAVDSHLLRVQAVGQTLALESSLAEGDMARFHAHARKVVQTSGLAANVVLRDKNEQLVLNALQEFGASLPVQPSRQHVRRVLSTGTPAISGPYRVPQFNQPIISIDVPVVVQGQVAYSLGISVFPEHLNAILKLQNLQPGWVVAVLDDTGTVAARNITPEKFVGNKATPSLLQALATSREGSSESISLEGISVQTSFSHSPTTNWAVAIGIPTNSLQEAMIISLARLAAGLAVMFIVGLVLAWTMGGRIAHSVRALTAPAIALGRGESVQAPRVHVKEAAEVGAALVNAAQLLRQHDAELQAREADLAQAHTRLRDVIDSSPALIYLKDMQGKFLLVNKTYENLFNRNPNCVITDREKPGQVSGYTPHEEGPSVPDLEVLKKGQNVQFEEKIETAEGVKYFAVSKAPLRGHEGQMIGICAAAVDITSLKMAEAQVRELVATLEKRVEQRTEELRVANVRLLSVNDQLKDANSQLEAFSYTVAHDLRAPLRGIQGFADALAEDYADAVDATGNDYLQRISKAAGRMEQLIDDLLSFSRLARMELPLGDVSLDDVFQQVVLNLGAQIRAGHATVRIEPHLPRVHANKTACLQVFQNLVSNALKFAMENTQASIRIWSETPVDTREETANVEHNNPALVRIWVEDNGIGIPAGQQERIFRPFERLNGMSEYPGSGIGLAIVDKAVRRMHGRCGVESEFGAGSRFWVELPASTVGA